MNYLHIFVNSIHLTTPPPSPNGSFGAAAFGIFTSTTIGPRIVQFALCLKPIEFADPMAYQNC